MILYFADRFLNVLGQANTKLPKGFTIIDDTKTEDIETGVAIFECKISFNDSNRADLEGWAEVGNYILRSHEDEHEFYQIVDVEIDTKKQQIYVYAEDDGLDLLNEVVGSYEASQPYPISHYINKYTEGAGWTIGINEIEGLTRQLTFDSEQTATARILSIAEQFGGVEISYSFEISGLMVKKKYINIHQKRGADNGIQLRLNKEIDSIITTKTISNLATALQCTGGTPEDAETAITLEGYTYDDGDFFTEGAVLKSRKALEKWHRYLWKNDATQQSGGYIVKTFSSNALSQAELCEQAIEKLKTISDTEINFEADITHLPDNVRVGDRVSVIDDHGNLYVSTRILTLETSAVDDSRKAVLGEFLIKQSGIHQKVADLAAEFAKSTVSIQRAATIAKTAQTTAKAAKMQAEAAAVEAQAAQTKADEAKTAADAVSKSAANALAKARAAEAAVGKVEESVSTMETTIENAQAAADNAHAAAETATEKAEEAKTAADNAVTDAEKAKTAAGYAQTAAESAITKADGAISTANEAKTTAKAASDTAQAAKLDAEQAERDIASFESQLENVSSTMKADYARKTDLTESEAQLQTQITQNAAGLSSTAKKVQKIDETTNDAHKLLQGAIALSEKAQAEADEATEEAEAAQNAADEAAQAATDAQSEADIAKAAANTAQSVADEAEATLAAARADLETLEARADATEEEITAAREAVETAMQAANTAKSNAIAAGGIAAEAQAIADASVLKANGAQKTANKAAEDAAIAQMVADEAKGKSEAAKAAADDAAAIAVEAQATAQTAVEDAENAQAVANEAAKQATNAIQTADDAQRKVVRASSDLAAAQQNLADVMARVDATEEEVAAAQDAVNVVQSYADLAQEEAETAQDAANEAIENAETAQTAADTAKMAAENVQAAANEAWQAAYKARGEVYGLAVRVDNAETQITQNASQVALSATRQEVSKMLGGYSTTEEMNAAINVKADGITSTVKDVKTTADNATKNIQTASSEIRQLAEMISMLVTDGTGASLMTQTENGWAFSIGEIIDSITKANEDIGDVSGTLDETTASVDSLKQAVNDLGVMADYVIITKASKEVTEVIVDNQEHYDYSIQSFVYTLPSDDTVITVDGWGMPSNILMNYSVVEGMERGDIYSLSSLSTPFSLPADLPSEACSSWKAGTDIKVVFNSDIITSAISTYQNGQPCIELGEKDSGFKLRITNTEIQFADGTIIPAYISNERLMIEQAEVKDELQIGGFVWRKRSNGNMGISWKGVFE